MQQGVRPETTGPRSERTLLPPLRWNEERDEPYLELEHGGERYTLTMWRESDADDMVRNWNHPLVGKWSFRRPYPYTHDHMQGSWDLFLFPDRKHIESYRSLIPPTHGRYLLRALRTSEGKMIGNLDLFKVEDEHRWEIAYDLDPDHWGKGLGTMIVDFLVRWAAATGVELISARADTRNVASQKVLQRNGFKLKFTRWNDLPEDKGPGRVEFGQWERTP